MAVRWNRGAYECKVYNPATKKLEYVALARDRIIADSPLLNTHAEAA
jgi:hypothetical protein